MLRSPFAHAAITSIDTSEGKRLDGVVDVLTAADLRGGVLPFSRPFYAKVHPAVLEIFHNRLRRHSALEMLTPIEFEQREVQIVA